MCVLTLRHLSDKSLRKLLDLAGKRWTGEWRPLAEAVRSAVWPEMSRRGLTVASSGTAEGVVVPAFQRHQLPRLVASLAGCATSFHHDRALSDLAIELIAAVIASAVPDEAARSE